MRQLKIEKSITNRSEESLNKYLADISRIPMISAEQEVELAKKIHTGGQSGAMAKEKLIVSNLRFVVSVAKQYQHQGVPLVDLINEGNLGLITAAEKFDETRGFKFISYAIWWVRQSILQAIADNSSTIRTPQNQIGINNKIKKATNEFLHENQRDPSTTELSEMTSLEIDKIEKAIQLDAYVMSIDTPLVEGEENTLVDIIASGSEYATDRHVNSESVCSDLIQVLNAVLSERERTIILQSFGIGCPKRELDDIGNDMGLSRERVRQIRKRGLEKVRESKASNLLLMHLGS